MEDEEELEKILPKWYMEVKKKIKEFVEKDY